MPNKRSVDELSVRELERLLAIRRREERLRRVRRLAEDGRLMNTPPPELEPAPQLALPAVEPAGATARYGSAPLEPEKLGRFRMVLDTISAAWASLRPTPADLRRIGNRFLLLVELLAAAGLLLITWDSWQTRQALNREAAQAQQKVIQESFPTPSPTPLIGVVLLPGGHTSPISENGPLPGEAGGIPDHLLPLVAAYKPPPIPTPAPEQARRIVISAINVDHPIVQGDDYEQLKKGVGQHVGSADPGTPGNLVLTAHNDIYGEIFRRLDELQPGDQVIIYTASNEFVYTVLSQRIVEFTEVGVMAPTRRATVTLISCYPYLVDTHRIVVTGSLKET